MKTSNQTTPVKTPFKVLWAWLLDRPGRDNANTRYRHKVSQTGPHERHTSARAGLPLPASSPSQRRPVTQRALRVVRVLDADSLPSTVGRLRISGRMADVCAELDRLAAYEARLH